MARKPKAPREEKPEPAGGVSAENGKLTAPAPNNKTRTATSAKKNKPAAARKPSPKQTPASDPKRAASRGKEPTDDEIRLRAYFLAERRHRLSLPGDSNHDWIEARRQLIEETNR